MATALSWLCQDLAELRQFVQNGVAGALLPDHYGLLIKIETLKRGLDI
jgi:hypothetical protein